MKPPETDVPRTIEDYLSSGKDVVLDYKTLFDDPMGVSGAARQFWLLHQQTARKQP